MQRMPFLICLVWLLGALYPGSTAKGERNIEKKNTADPKSDHKSDLKVKGDRNFQNKKESKRENSRESNRERNGTDLKNNKIRQTNLLFIMFDDLRPELSIYGKAGIITPNFERLAARSVVFDHAYSQISVCNPSRDSLLTGLRPDTVGTYAFQSSYNTYKNHMIFPTQLKRSGYKTGKGKD
jgi:hypothetical protein